MVTYYPDILPFNIVVCRSNELDSLTDFVDENGNKIMYDESALGEVVRTIQIDKEHNTRTCYSMLIFKERPTSKTIAHEAFHSACDLLENIGIHYEKYGDNEIYAYTIGYIVNCINDALNKDKIWE